MKRMLAAAATIAIALVGGSGTVAAAADGLEVRSQPTRFGEILFDGSSQAIYLFDKETTSRPECYDQCALAWPPVLTDGTPRAGGKVRASLLGTTKRSGGQTQVTYDGHPLYYYAHEGRNEVKCHKVRGFGGLWLALTPSGRAAD